MIRNDFVSNSSSSSFIVSSEDNKFDLVLTDYQEFSLKEYIDHFLKREILGYDIYERAEINYVTKQRFCALFTISIRNTLPKECEKYINDIKDLYSHKPEGKWDSEEIKDFYESINVLEQLIKDECFKTLKSKYKKMKFHYSEVNDYWIEKYEQDNCSLLQDKIDYLMSLRKFDFYRKFDNH